MSNVGRVITLVVEIQTSEYPKWIMDAHMKGGANDVKVRSIAEGDIVAKHQKLEYAVNEEIASLDDYPLIEDAVKE